MQCYLEKNCGDNDFLTWYNKLISPAGSDSLPGAAQIIQQIKEGGFLEKFYSNTQYLGERYRPLFRQLLDLPAGEALMYHCTGGRDRTGMATALFLYALGVPRETIEADYTASNVYLEPMNARMFKSFTTGTGLDEATVRKAMELRPEYLRRMFSAIETKYGSVERFFEKELGMGPKELKQLRQKYTI